MIFSVRHVSKTSDQTLFDAFLQTDDWRKEQLQRIKSPLAKRQCLLGDALSRELIAKICGKRELHFSRDKNGKPFVSDACIHFNVSHSGDHVLCAVDETPVGADIEELRKIDPNLISKVCSEQEVAWIGGKSDRFLQVWTAKEAFLKYLGIGLKLPLREVNVVIGDHIRLEGLELITDLNDHYAMTIVYEKRHL